MWISSNLSRTLQGKLTHEKGKKRYQSQLYTIPFIPPSHRAFSSSSEFHSKFSLPSTRFRILSGHRVQCTPIFEPFNLCLVECMRKLRVPCRPVLRVYSQRHGLPDLQLSTHKIQLVVRIDLVVVGRINKSQRKHTLFLEVGLVLNPVVSLLALFNHRSDTSNYLLSVQSFE